MRCLAMLLPLAFVATAEAQNLLEDPGFELATSGGQTSNSAWVLFVNFPDGAAASAQFETAPWASNPGGTAGTGIWIKSFEGNADPGDTPADATIQQDVPGTEGMEYTFSVWHKQETHFTTTSTRLGIVFFDGSGTSLDVSFLEMNGLHPRDGLWYEFSLTGTAPAGTATVRVFAEMIDGVIGPGNPQSGMLDDFSLVENPGTPVEKTTWGRIKARNR